jgi:hypothetical protein
MTQRPTPERLSELAAERALFGLGPAEALELERLQSEHGASEARELELAAAELDLALAGRPLEPLSDSVRTALARAGEQWTAARQHEIAPSAPPGADPLAEARRAAIWPLAGWALAAAAAVVAVLGWLPREPQPVRAVDPAQAFDALRSVPGTLNPSFAATVHAPGAGGAVAWSQSDQQGFVHLVGLPANDPTVEQYQLWILDAEQKQPIDAGVFDVAGGESWIAIDPNLAVARPTAFAVTLEKPGGVVVSALDRVVLMATL